MTKSVKEKARLAKIKECNSLGIPVPSECFKFSISFIKKKLDKNVNRRLNRLKFVIDNPSWSVAPSIAFIKENIEELIFGPLRQIGIYDVKIKLLSYYHIKERIVYVNIKIIPNKKNKVLGIILCRSINRDDSYSDCYSSYINFPESFVDKIHGLTPMNHLLSELRFLVIENITMYKKLYFYNEIIKISSIYHDFLDELKINNDRNISFYANKNKFSFNDHHEGESYYYPPIDDFTELDIVKMLLHFKIIDLSIPDDELIIENLPEIKNLIKMSTY